jgi:hypothetical protein
MGEALDKLVAAQQTELLELSALERVKSYRRKVNGREVQVSAHTRKGDGPGKAEEGKYATSERALASVKSSFVNKHGVDIVALHKDDEVSLAPGDWFTPWEPEMYADSKTWNKSLLKNKWRVIDWHGDQSGDMVTVRLITDGVTPPVIKVPAESITKVLKKDKSVNADQRDALTEARRKKWNEARIADLEASELGDSVDARISEIDKLIAKLEKERSQLRGARLKARRGSEDYDPEFYVPRKKAV